MPAASPAMLLWWLAASLSSAVYFHPEVMLDERTDLSRFVRSLHVTTCAAMASLAVAALFPSRIDVALSCAGDAPEALRCLTAYGLVYVCGLLCLLLETLLRHGLFSRACAMRISQAALASLFGQVVSHRGELLCAAQRSGETPRARMTFCAVYAWAALAFQLCNRIEASLDDRALDGESDDDFSDDDDVEVRCRRRFSVQTCPAYLSVHAVDASQSQAGDFVADAAAGLKAAMSTVENDLRSTIKGDKKY